MSATRPSDDAAPPSDKTRLRRYNWLGKYGRGTINAIIDAGIVCQSHTPGPTKRHSSLFYFDLSRRNVFSRAAFNYNVNFRSVVAFGEAEFCQEDAKRRALQVFTDRLAPGLWDYARLPKEQEWKASKVIRLKLDKVSAKVRMASQRKTLKIMPLVAGPGQFHCVLCSFRRCLTQSSTRASRCPILSRISTMVPELEGHARTWQFQDLTKLVLLPHIQALLLHLLAAKEPLHKFLIPLSIRFL